MIRKIIGWILIIYALIPNVLIFKINEDAIMLEWNINNHMLYNVVVNIISIFIFLIGYLLIMGRRKKSK